MTDTKHSAVEQVARAMAIHAGWDGWDTATDCRHTSSGNEPEDERQYWRDLAAIAIAAAAPAGEPVAYHLTWRRGTRQCLSYKSAIDELKKTYGSDADDVVVTPLVAATGSLGHRDGKHRAQKLCDQALSNVVVFEAGSPAAAPKAALTDGEIEQAARDYVDPRRQLDWSMPENLGCTAVQRAAFSAGLRRSSGSSLPPDQVRNMECLIYDLKSECRELRAALAATGVKP